MQKEIQEMEYLIMLTQIYMSMVDAHINSIIERNKKNEN